MKIFRSKKDKELYKIYRASPMKYTGSWYEAEQCYTGKLIVNAKLKDFTLVYEV
jgi:hypothetical protein